MIFVVIVVAHRMVHIVSSPASTTESPVTFSLVANLYSTAHLMISFCPVLTDINNGCNNLKKLQRSFIWMSDVLVRNFFVEVSS